MTTSAKPRLTIVNGEPMTTTAALAEQLGMPHAQLLRRVQAAFKQVPADFSRSHFLALDCKGPDGEPQTMYRLTRAGMEYLATGVGGARGLRCLVAYTQAYKSLSAGLSGTPAEAAAGADGRGGRPAMAPPAGAPAPAGSRPPRDLVSRVLPEGMSAQDEAALREALAALAFEVMAGGGGGIGLQADLLARVLPHALGGRDVGRVSDAQREEEQERWLSRVVAKGWAPDADLVWMLSRCHHQSPPDPEGGWLCRSYEDLARDIGDTSADQVRAGLDRLRARRLVEQRTAVGGGGGLEFRLNLKRVAEVLNRAPIVKATAQGPRPRPGPADRSGLERTQEPARAEGQAGGPPVSDPGAGSRTLH